MCRIVGFLDNNYQSSEEVLLQMRDTMIKGGPDASGIYFSDKIGLAHRRLSIIDLSISSDQPLFIGDYVITFNGEIYNYKEIRSELLNYGYEFKTASDTEVIVWAYDFWGPAAFEKFRGMFAFALWNIKSEKLVLCRDRLGVKPLYFYFKDGLLLFSSEIKSFHKHPSFDKSYCLDGLPYFFQKGYFHPSHLLFKFVKHLPPGNYFEVSEFQNEIVFISYWNLDDIYSKSILDQRDELVIQNDLENQLIKSFNLRMISDVEVGILLSGGIDSSLIAALLQKDSTNKINSYTIGFENKEFDESDFAAKIASYIGTNHETYFCTSSEVKHIIPLLPEIYDEPFGDTSSIPTILISKFTSQSVKVVLSGDGADELFGGYSKYQFAKRFSSIVLNIPLSIRSPLNELLKVITPQQASNIYKIFFKNKYIQFENRYHKLQEVLVSNNLEDFFQKSSNVISDADLKLFTNKNNINYNIFINSKKNSLITCLGLQDIKTYLPGDIFMKIDRASMFFGLEAREPYLDPELISIAFCLSDVLKISSHGDNKFLLRNILNKYIPKELFDRPKQGFTPPLDEWLNSFLKEEILDLKSDHMFFNTFGLNQSFFSSVLTSYYFNEKLFYKQFIWHVFCLYKWYIKWH
jgi:asparagine synthase (glutamine-hydrolysing)